MLERRWAACCGAHPRCQERTSEPYPAPQRRSRPVAGVAAFHGEEAACLDAGHQHMQSAAAAESWGWAWEAAQGRRSVAQAHCWRTPAEVEEDHDRRGAGARWQSNREARAALHAAVQQSGSLAVHLRQGPREAR